MPSPNSVPEKTGKEDRANALRVVIVAPRLENLVGGQEVQADLLLRSWQSDPDVQASYVPSNPELPRWLERVRYLRTLARFPLYLASLARGLRNADVVHIFSTASSGFFISTVPACGVARMLGKKVIVNYRSGLARKHMTASSFARRILRSADKVLVPSTYLHEVFREFGIDAQAIPNLVDLNAFSFRSRNPLRPMLLCSRNFEPLYGIDIVVRAFAQIQKTFPEARLWLLGEGSQENAIRKLIADLHLKGVELPGRIPREKVGKFYNEADILINASRVDNMPVSILEAFASGLPVATTNAGGIPYIVQHEQTGLLSDTDNIEQLAANVNRLLQDPTLAHQLTENAYRQSATYHWSSIREEWLGAYRDLRRDASGQHLN
jgi:glycosyltransferase involved in cell wall biosynthesis